MKGYCAAICLLLSSQAWAGNFAECILDKMPGVNNDVAASVVWRSCSSEHPGGIESVKQGSGRGLFGYADGAACTIKRASSTPSVRAAQMINSACRKLYDENGPWMDYQRN